MLSAEMPRSAQLHCSLCLVWNGTASLASRPLSGLASVAYSPFPGWNGEVALVMSTSMFDLDVTTNLGMLPKVVIWCLLSIIHFDQGTL